MGEAYQLISFAIGDRQLGDVRSSADGLLRALRLLRAVGHRLGEAYALDQLGLTCQLAGDHGQAVDCHEQALAITQPNSSATVYRPPTSPVGKAR
ncbi:tetratricopeptide repeat protein, partial [Luedemannella flava]